MNRNATADVVFLLDVDNTLLDNDRIIADLRSHLEAAFGSARAGCSMRFSADIRRATTSWSMTSCVFLQP